MTTVQEPTKPVFAIQNLETIQRITNLPLFESGWHLAEDIYVKIKNSNTIFQWTLDKAESGFQLAVDSALPSIAYFESPITSIDKVLLKGLDIVEQQIPAITLEPVAIYSNTKNYVTEVSNRIVAPVLKRADSVRQIGNIVLASKYTALAAETLDEALDAADKYVDKYLPEDDQNETVVNNHKDENTNRAVQTIHHMGRFSGKLQRRLTRRTLAEAKALKDQTAEAIHALIYVAELIATDPKLALTKGRELWENLSKNQPDNQAKPENLEQLIILLTRETARRVVHFINYTKDGFSKFPKRVNDNIVAAASAILDVTNSILKNMEGIQRALLTTLRYQIQHFTILLKQLNTYISDLMETVEQSSSEQNDQKSALDGSNENTESKAVNMKNSNGVDSNSN